jgi:hypothetical protein
MKPVPNDRQDMHIRASAKVVSKLEKKHSVTMEEVHQCFDNREGLAIKEIRPEHKTDPPTRWFLAETNRGRLLKVVYVLTRIGDKGLIDLRTAFPPGADDIAYYELHGK